jgi:signal transduction histidine kinase
VKPRLIVIYVLIVLAPLAALGWLGATLARNEQAMVAVRFREVLTGKLSDTATIIGSLIEQRERELTAQSNLSTRTPADLRALAAASGIVRQYFVLDGKGDLVYPSPTGALNATEEEFLRRTRTIWANGEIPGPDLESNIIVFRTTKSESNRNALEQRARTVRPTQLTGKGWHSSFWGNGVSLLYWWRDERGAAVGAELNESRLLSDIIGLLPDSNSPESDYLGRKTYSSASDCTALMDPKGAVIYQWGAYLPAEHEIARAELPLPKPLEAWSLKYYSPEVPEGVGGKFNVIVAVLAFGIALLIVALYFFRENTRAMREALQRVSFVNQVSHELKTPLTNIRMYAEMLDADLGESSAESRKRLGVIVSESQRLSRLINNVLTFGRNQRNHLTLHRSAGNVDDALRALIANFEASLNARGVVIEFEAAAGHEAEFDRDALDQIMGNLLSNVEKYAPNSGRLDIVSQQNGETISVIVSDRGPGIPHSQREHVFEPFYRVSDKLTDGVAGAGIGLTIARQLARLHGGDLTLQPSPQGASFIVTLRAPLRQSGGLS